MATYSGFFNAVDHDRLYNATDFSKFFDGLIADGVYVNFPENETEENRGLHVSPNTEVSGLSIKVAPGRCWFNGYWMYNDAFLPITLDNLLTTLVSRIDAIVVDVNGADSARTVDIVVVKGTEAQTPDKPSLVHTSTHNQYALAYVTVVPGATAISTQNIEDAILSGETPAVEALLEYSSRSKAEMKTYIDNADTAIQNQVNDIKTPTFTEAAELANLAGSGEGINTMWGKVKKLLSTILSVLPVNYGGTGSATHTTNSVLLGNGNSAIKNKASANGAFYSTGNGVEPSFGTLPMAQGGTGVAAANASELREALGVADASTAASVTYVNQKATITDGKVRVGNGTDTPNERGIDTTNGGTANSTDFITSGAVNAFKQSFLDGCDAVANALIAKGVTPAKTGGIYQPENFVDAMAIEFSNYQSNTKTFTSSFNWVYDGNNTFTMYFGTGNGYFPEFEYEYVFQNSSAFGGPYNIKYISSYPSFVMTNTDPKSLYPSGFSYLTDLSYKLRSPTNWGTLTPTGIYTKQDVINSINDISVNAPSYCRGGQMTLYISESVYTSGSTVYKKIIVRDKTATGTEIVNETFTKGSSRFSPMLNVHLNLY